MVRPQQVVIYSLADPRTNEIRYIGKADYFNRRVRQHVSLCNRGNAKRQVWVRELVSLGLKPIAVEIETVDRKDWQAREIYWIAHYRGQGLDLVNTTIGGGRSNGIKLTLEQRAKISARFKGKPLSAEHKARVSEGMRGVLHTEERKARRRGRYVSPETRKKMSESHKGRLHGPMSEEHKKAVSRGKMGQPSPNKGKKLSDERIEKTAAKLRGRPWTAEAHEAHRVANAAKKLLRSQQC